jgi:ATP-dependent exoDNAse (exonuclease V) beta subunit
MTELADAPARLRALTDLASTLLVEAAAGTGKTALMAGRLTMLLASGAERRRAWCPFGKGAEGQSHKHNSHIDIHTLPT